MEAPSKVLYEQCFFIPEEDVYRLVVYSKLPAAEKFEKLVFYEVIPSILYCVLKMSDLIQELRWGRVL